MRYGLTDAHMENKSQHIQTKKHIWFSTPCVKQCFLYFFLYNLQKKYPEEAKMSQVVSQVTSGDLSSKVNTGDRDWSTGLLDCFTDCTSSK